MKRRSAPPSGPLWLGKDFRLGLGYTDKAEIIRSDDAPQSIIIIIILFVHKKMYIKHINKTSEQYNKALRSALTAALSTIIAIVKININ